MQKPEAFNILDVPRNIVSKAAKTVAVAEKMCIRVRWIDKVLREIDTKRYLLFCSGRLDC